MKNYWLAVALLLMLVVTIPAALSEPDFNKKLTADEQKQVDAILAPVMKVYNTIKYVATVVGVLMLSFAGVALASSGADPEQKKKAKNTVIGVVVGLIVIWVAPLIVKFVFS